MKQYKAYIFDLYGTLVDIRTDESCASLWRELALFYGYQGASYEPEELKQRYEELVAIAEEKLSALDAETFPDAVNPHIEIQIEPIFEALYEEKSVKPSEDLIKYTAQFFRASSTRFVRLYAGAKELLEGLRAAGKQVYLLSNAQRSFTLYELQALGIYECFDRVYISSDAGVKKPDPRFYEKLLRENGLDVADCLMIGNDLSCDVAGAKGVGMDSYYIHTAISPELTGEPDSTYYMLHMDEKALLKRLLN